MIKYQLICDSEHNFESWFSNSATFDRMNDHGDVACPVCGSTSINKTIMAPNVSSATRRKGVDAQVPAITGNETNDTITASSSVDYSANPAQKELLRKLRDHLVENAEYVGDRFAEEARSIHYEETEQRGIYGEATLAEAKELLDEGIELCPLPKLPEDNN